MMTPLIIKALATASICCSPPDRVPPSCHSLSFRRGNIENTRSSSSGILSRSLRQYVASLRFSWTVRFAKIPRPSGTWAIPASTMLCGARVVSSVSRSLIDPVVCFTSPEIALSVVDLPAPFAPIKVTICPSSTSMEIPLTAVMFPYDTHKSLMERRGVAITKPPFRDKLRGHVDGFEFPEVRQLQLSRRNQGR